MTFGINILNVLYDVWYKYFEPFLYDVWYKYFDVLYDVWYKYFERFI